MTPDAHSPAPVTLADIEAIVRDVLDNPRIALQPQMTARDIEGWDSLSHIQIVVALEKHFGVRFTAAELVDLSTIGDLARAIDGKLA